MIETHVLVRRKGITTAGIGTVTVAAECGLVLWKPFRSRHHASRSCVRATQPHGPIGLYSLIPSNDHALQSGFCATRVEP